MPFPSLTSSADLKLHNVDFCFRTILQFLPWNADGKKLLFLICLQADLGLWGVHITGSDKFRPCALVSMVTGKVRAFEVCVCVGGGRQREQSTDSEHTQTHTHRHTHTDTDMHRFTKIINSRCPLLLLSAAMITSQPSRGSCLSLSVWICAEYMEIKSTETQ